MTKCPHCGTALKIVKDNTINIINDGLIFDTDKLKPIHSKDCIVIHHSASSDNWTIQDIHKLHRDGNKWAGCGYHYVIHKDGSVHKGRPDNIAGAHCVGYNYSSIGICVIGNFEENKPTDVQLESLSSLIEYLKINKVYNHTDLYATQCPGNNLIRRRNR